MVAWIYHKGETWGFSVIKYFNIFWPLDLRCQPWLKCGWDWRERIQLATTGPCSRGNACGNWQESDVRQRTEMYNNLTACIMCNVYNIRILYTVHTYIYIYIHEKIPEWVSNLKMELSVAHWHRSHQAALRLSLKRGIPTLPVSTMQPDQLRLRIDLWVVSFLLDSINSGMYECLEERMKIYE